MPISLKEFNSFFEAMRNGTYKCAFCGNETFTGNVIDNAASTVVEAKMIIPAGPDNTATGTHQFYSFSCKKCGRTDFFHSNQVEEWFAVKKASENG